MDSATFWSAIAAIGTCVAAIVAILTYRKTIQPQGHTATCPSKTASPVNVETRLAPATDGVSEVDFSLELVSQNDSSSRTIRGTTAGRRGPRDLDVTLRGKELIFYMHPPGKWTGARFRIPLATFKKSAESGARVFASPVSGKELALSLHEDAPDEIATDEARLEGDWWVYVPKKELREALRVFGVEVDW